MKLTASSRYLSLLLDTFELQVVPDLQSPGVRGNSGFFINTLKELLRRERHYTSVLPSINAEGDMLVTELRAVLGAKASTHTHGENTVGSKDTQNDPIIIFEHLNTEIAELAERLSLRGDKLSQPSPDLLRQAAEWECGAHNKLLSLGKNDPAGRDEKNIDPLSRETFQSYIRSVHPDGDKVQVTAYERVLGGFGNQTWAVTVRDSEAVNHHWIIRKKERIAIIEYKPYNLEREFHLVRAVNSTGFLAPKPLWMAKNVPGSDAPFYVMERLPGKPPGSFLGGTDKLPEALVLEWAELLAKLHSLPLELFDDFIREFDSPHVLTETIEQNFRRNLVEWRAYVKAIKHLPSPSLVYLFDWLERNVPKDGSRPVLTHGDFGIHNMLINDGHVSALLDWEATAFGSPALDLSYVKPVVEQHMDWQRFMQHYQDCGGQPISAASLIYCNVFQAMKISVPINRATKLLQDGDLSEIRHTIFELGLNPHFMNMALASTASDRV